MGHRLFCELSPFTYWLSVLRCRVVRVCADFFRCGHFARERQEEPLPVVIYRHKSLIRRKLGGVDMRLQENKAVNLAIAAPHIDRVVIRPGETFSFWRLVGRCTARRGYREGLVIAGGRPSSGVGGGMCQFTNLLHWMVLHTDLTITEHHHHDRLDLFPDFGRQIPFGTGTSIFWNYLDYRFRNDTDNTYQILVSVGEEYLCGEIRAERQQRYSYHVGARGEYFSREPDGVYRNGEVYRRVVDRATGGLVREELLRRNHAKVLYDTAGLTIADRVPDP